MNKNKNLGLSIFFTFLTIVLIAAVTFSVGVNYIFGSSLRSGSIFGKNIFVMNSDIMEPEISNGSAVIADNKDISVLTEGNVILFSEEAGIENIMRIVEIEFNDKNTIYKAAGDNAQDNIVSISKEDVIAKCTTESKRLGSIITFLKSMAGIIIGMIVPAVILFIMLIIKILSVRKRQYEEDNIIYPETNGIGSGNNEERDYSSNPLFDPAMVPKPDADFMMKKSSIAENFSMKPSARKPVPSGPSERNAETESAFEKFRAAVDEKPLGPVSRRASLAPEVTYDDKSEKMAAIKAALNSEENHEELYVPEEIPAESVSVQPSEQTFEEPEPEPVPKKHNNIKSIDDLIKVLEEEKKKL